MANIDEVVSAEMIDDAEETVVAEPITAEDEAAEEAAENAKRAEDAAEKKERAELRAKEASRKAKNRNSVELTGTIVKMAVGKGNCCVVTLRSESANGAMANYPSVFFFSSISAQVNEQYKVGDRVRIVGRINTYDPETIRKGQVPILAVGDSISLYAPDDGSAAGEMIDVAPVEDINRFEVAGLIDSLKKSGNKIYIGLFTVIGRSVTRYDYEYIARDVKKTVSELHLNDYVRLEGQIQTAQLPVAGYEDSVKKDQSLVLTGPNEAAKLEARPIKTRKVQLYPVFRLTHI